MFPFAKTLRALFVCAGTAALYYGFEWPFWASFILSLVVVHTVYYTINGSEV